MARKFRQIAVIGFTALAALGAVSAGPAGAAQGAAPIPDFSGMWSRTTFGLELPASGPGPVRNLNRRSDGTADPRRIAGDYANPILKPEAAELVKKRSEISRSGADYPTPSNQCWPMVAPYIFRVQGMEVLQNKDQVVFLYMQDHQVRRVRLNQPHPAHVAPSWHGDSVGRYEGDTLVIDTVGVRAGPVPMLDMYGTPYSEALHVVERYRLVGYEAAKAAQDRNEREYGHPTTEQAASIDVDYKGKGLQVEFTVEDKNVFTMPWSGAATYRKAGGDWVENVCAENTHEYYAGRDTAVPEAGKPDF